MSEAGSRTPSPLRDSPPDDDDRRVKDSDRDEDPDDSGSDDGGRRRRRNRSESSRRRRRRHKSSRSRRRDDSDDEDDDDEDRRRRRRPSSRRDRSRERDSSRRHYSRSRHRRGRSRSDSRERYRRRRHRSSSESGDDGSERSRSNSSAGSTKKKSNFTPAGFTMPQHMSPAAAALLAAAGGTPAAAALAASAGIAAPGAAAPVPGAAPLPANVPPGVLGDPSITGGTGLLGASPAGGLPAPGALGPGLQQFPGLLNMVTNTQADKTARELFVGNTPPGTSELVLMEFLNAAMKQVKLNTSPGNPIISCRMSTKFAFIELRSSEEANNCLSINGIPFMGYYLKVGRPTKYQGPHVQASTWQALTGQHVDQTIVDPSTKVYRELYIGNVSPEMTETSLQEFLGSAMAQVGLTTSDGNPILQVRLSGTFAFVEIRTVEEASHMMNLNGIPFMGQFLKIKRPTKFPGPEIPHLNWEDILAKYMAGELKAKPGAGAGAAVAPAPTAAAPSAASPGTPSKVMTLSNMVTKDDLEDDETYEEIVEDTKEECEKYGTVQSLQIPRPKDGPHGIGLVFVQFSNEGEAKKAIDALKGRTFAGNKVEAKFFPEDKYLAKDYSDSTSGASNPPAAAAQPPPGVAEAQAAAAAFQLPPPPAAP